MNKRTFLKMLGLGSLAPVASKAIVNSEKEPERFKPKYFGIPEYITDECRIAKVFTSPAKISYVFEHNEYDDYWMPLGVYDKRYEALLAVENYLNSDYCTENH